MKKRQVTRERNRVAATKSYASKTTPKDWKASRAKYTQGKTVRQDVNRSNRYAPEQRTVVVNRYNNVYGGYAYADPYNHSLIWSFSMIWWAHHWHSIDRHHYGNDARMKELEKEVAVLRAKADFKEDSSYADKDMDKGVMYSDGYLKGVKSGKVTEKSFDEKEKSYFWWWAGGFLVVGMGVGVWFRFRG
jgi:hypothetical protein